MYSDFMSRETGPNHDKFDYVAIMRTTVKIKAVGSHFFSYTGLYHI